MHNTVLDQIQKRWNDAAAAWDIKALARIYSKDALFFGLLPRLYIGRPEVEEYFGSYLDKLQGVTLTLVNQNIRSLDDGVFAAQGFGDIVNRYFDGSIVRNMVRSSFVIVENAGEWEIALHHFSELNPRRNAGMESDLPATIQTAARKGQSRRSTWRLD